MSRLLWNSQIFLYTCIPCLVKITRATWTNVTCINVAWTIDERTNATCELVWQVWFRTNLKFLICGYINKCLCDIVAWTIVARTVVTGRNSYTDLIRFHDKFEQDLISYYWDIDNSNCLSQVPNFLFTYLITQTCKF